jgi:methyl-accepting chemotaxis protein
VQEIGRQVSGSSDLAQTAVGEADQTMQLVQALSQASARIGDMVGLISNIASQTNLLALNATIEAARAGELGRGFAVVASEVKDLAQETAAATQRITERITALQEDSQQATASIEGVTALITRISDGQSSVAGAVEEQSVTTNEISSNVGDVAATANATTAAVASMTAAVVDVAAKAEELRGLVSRKS